MKRCAQLSNNKRCKLFHLFGFHLSDDKDRITNLDENLLRQILSRLPTKDVVRTSILSKGWRYKWTISYNMVISDSDANCLHEKGSFVKFINRILKYSQPQRSIRLIIHTAYCSNLIQDWVSRVLTHNLKVLEVQCFSRIVIPCSLLNSTHLQNLKLILYKSTLNVALLNCAPNLTSLYIKGLEIVNENHNASTTVKFSFPLLESCTLLGCKWWNVKSVELHAPSLTSFISKPSGGHVEFDYSILILAPKLAIFKCGTCIPEKFILDGSSVVSADFDCNVAAKHLLNFKLRANIGVRVRNLLNDFKNLEELHLRTYFVEVSRLGPPLQRHDKLRQLTLPDQINAEDLFPLLQAAPSLKLLRLNVFGCADYDYEAIKPVPSCIVSHLEEVEFEYFYCQKAQYNLLKFLSINGEKLKKLRIRQFPWSPFPLGKQNEVQEFVSVFRNVEVDFQCDDYFY